MADQEEMKKQEKQNQIEMERKRADAKAAAESRNQVYQVYIFQFLSFFFHECFYRIITVFY